MDSDLVSEGRGIPALALPARLALAMRCFLVSAAAAAGPPSLPRVDATAVVMSCEQ